MADRRLVTQLGAARVDLKLPVFPTGCFFVVLLFFRFWDFKIVFGVLLAFQGFLRRVCGVSGFRGPGLSLGI